MLDPDEVAAYEEWKARKASGSIDLSVTAYNSEMESQAVAYEKGVKDAVKDILEAVGDHQKARSVTERLVAASPFRKPGMRGHTPS